ncbi:hypothetical protein [Rhodocista pekingensis]|uniref:Uncharacterized protein n=1 Tax=Rhodocista pekingensis TaxID=201185 RepID=A0ABW2KY66_9PROT
MMVGSVISAVRASDPLPPSAARTGTDSADTTGLQPIEPAIYFNPKLRFDSDANVVVIEFRDLKNGELQRSIPTQAQLDAYERAARITRDEELRTAAEKLAATATSGPSSSTATSQRTGSTPETGSIGTQPAGQPGGLSTSPAAAPRAVAGTTGNGSDATAGPAGAAPPGSTEVDA